MSTGMDGRRALPLLGGYPAKQCPRRVHNAFDRTVPAPPQPPEAVLRRMAEGRAFEADTVVPMLVAALGTRCVSIDSGDHRTDKPRRIAETVAAMAAGVPVIIGAQLPDDTAAGRTGSPDLLMRATPHGFEAKYLPVDIKQHTSLKPTKRTSARVSALGDGFALRDAHGWSPMTSHRADDSLQLAHYTRMLQALDRHPGDDLLWGAVLGTSDFTQVTGERHGFVWYDLSTLTEKTPSKSSTTRWTKRSVLEVYDHEFAFRQKVAVAARDGETLVIPFGKAQCDQCPYLGWCHTAVGAQDVSFAITTGRLSDREWRYLYDEGLGTIDALASADPIDPTLLNGYLQVAAHLPVPEKRLATAVRRARMHRDNIPLEPTTAGFQVPAADVEIDFDVEWHPADGHVYQWGARVRYGQDDTTATYAHSVLSFDPLDDASAYQLAQDFFDWLEVFVDDQEAEGRSVGIYHWTTPETRLATKMLGGERADRLFEGRFVDLKALMASHFFARDGFSLKTVAPLFDFKWRSLDAGGETSVLKIEEARNTSNPATAQAAREWLLTYNEDDCKAQAAIRDGLSAQHRQEPPITDTNVASSPSPRARVMPETHDDADTNTPETAVEPEVVRSRPSNQGEPLPPTETARPEPAATQRAAASSIGGAGRALAMNEIRSRVAQFVINYADASREQSQSIGFWTAFLRCFGIEVPHQHDITFEYPARRARGGRGRIDVFQPAITGGDHPRDGFLIEQKSAGRVVTPAGRARSNAEEQAHDYLEGGDIPPHQKPRWVITSDFRAIQITDLTKPAAATGRTITFPTSDLADHIDDFLWLTGQDIDGLVAADQEEASVAAARLMASLYTTMTGDADVADDTSEDGAVGAVTPDDEDERTSEISVLLTRILFCLFADDANIVRWPTGAFRSFIANRTDEDGSNLGAQLNSLFDTLNKPADRRSPHLDEALEVFPYVNGDLFKTRTGIESFNAEMRNELLAACDFDWSRISPAVFGSMFQTVKSRAARHGDGEHYTTEENILKTLRPLFLDDLRRRINAATSAPQLEAIHHEMRQMRFVDPACGCGNFLVVAYREMRALELDLLLRLRNRTGEANQPVLDASALLKVTLDQFTGVELHWWPAKIAQVAMFLVDHQANRQMERRLGGIPDRLPLKISANIHNTNAVTNDWNTLLPGPEHTTYIFGNPPFVGYDDRSDAQRTELQTVWGTRAIGRLDYVTAWHAKAIAYYRTRTSGEFAFVSTNSIAQGEPVPLLFKPLFAAGWHIKFAHTTFDWTTEAPSNERAFVHCIIVGFTRDSATKQRLFTYATPKSRPTETTVRVAVNAYLVDAPNVVVDKSTTPVAAGLPPVKNGSVAGDTNRKIDALKGLDGLVMEPDAAESIRANDPAAAKYLRPYVGGADFLNGGVRYCLWMPDGPDPADLAASPELRRRLDNVRRVREASTEESTATLAATPYLFKHIAQPSTRYIVIPRTVTERRTYMALGYLEPDHIISNGSFWAEDPDGFVFAIASSAMFMAWQKAIGGRIKSDPRFANTLVWNNFPLPNLSETQRKDIIKAGKGVLDARATDTGRTLAQEYDPRGMSPGLNAAHRTLDKAVDKAFGLSRGRIDDHKRLQTLFAYYRDLTTPAP